jgi:hypothetical protein
MGKNSADAFTADKLKKFAVSGAGIGTRDRNSGAMADDYGRKAARSSDSSAFAAGGAAKAPSLGRAGRAVGGRVGRAGGGPIKRNIGEVTDAGPHRYAELPLVRAKGGRAKRADGGKAYGPQQDPDWRDWHENPQGHLTTSGGRLTPFEKFSVGMWDKSSADPRNWGSDSPDPNEPNPQPPRDDPERARGGRVGRARGGRAKGAKGKTVVNVIVGGKGDQQQPPPMPPHPMMPPPPPPMPPPQAAPPHPPMPPPGGMPGPPGAAGPPGAGGPPGMPPGLPPGMMPPGMGRARGGRISEKFGAGSGPGRIEKAKRENHGKLKLR